MALQKEYINEADGIKLNDAYYKISGIEVTKSSMRITLDVSCEKGMKTIKQIGFSTPIDVLTLEKNIIETAYDIIKSMPDFEEALDC